MSRPSFQFYTKDWRSNSKLRRCSPAARGVWVDILCALHDSDEYGVARYPLKELATEVGASMAHVRELVDKGVLKGNDAGTAEALVYVPRSGRREGPPVTLLPEQPGPIWYSSRMVKDEHVRTVRGEGSRFGADEGDAPKAPRKPSPKPPLSDGSSTATATAVSKTNGNERVERALAEAEADGITPSPGGLACRAIKAAGIADVNPGHPTLLRLLEAGQTAQTLAATAAELVGRGKGKFALLLATVEGRLRDAAQAAPLPATGVAAPPAADAWRHDSRAVLAMGRQLKVASYPDDVMPVFERRVVSAWRRAGCPALTEPLTEDSPA
jgi:hypothetical protein